MMAINTHWIPLLTALTLVGCDGSVYVRDGVTDGDAFYVPPVSLVSSDARTQSWIAYSLARSTCQLKAGGTNPARATSFDCELLARRILAERWVELLKPGDKDAYLDDLVRAEHSGFLPEYTAYYFADRRWRLPSDLRKREFKRWRKTNLQHHRAKTRIVGSWNYRSKTGSNRVE